MNCHATVNDTGGKHVLVLGGAGFLGSVLTRRLLELKYTVTIYDSFLYPSNSLVGLEKNDLLRVIRGDIRDIKHLKRIIQGKDIVINLAAIVGDAACDLDPEAAKEINAESNKHIYQIAGECGVDRFVFASTCSVYGFGKKLLNETSFLNPVSFYAQTKLTSELLLLSMSQKIRTALTILRFATLFGWSYRPRFDLVVNTMTSVAITDKKVIVYGGDQWRPHMHVKDSAEAILCVIESPISAVDGEILNVGANTLNMTVLDLGRRIVSLVPGCRLEQHPEAIDPRNYLVDFSKMTAYLNFNPRFSIEDGVREILHNFKCGHISDFDESIYSNAKSLNRKHLREARLITTARKSVLDRQRHEYHEARTE